MTAPSGGFWQSAAGPIIGGGLSAIGGFLGGNAADKAAKQQTHEQARQFNLSGWSPAAHSLENSALRDKLLAMFGQIAQQGPQQFQPRDAFNPSRNAIGQTQAPAQAQMGGMNPAQLSLPSNYKMGDGGVNPDVYSWLLRNLGYRPTDDPARMADAAKLSQQKAQYAQSVQPQQMSPVGPQQNQAYGMRGL